MPSTILDTARLRLEPVDDHHFDGLRRINGDPEVMRYITGRPETPEDTAAFVARHKVKWAQLGHAWWAFIARDSGEIVGTGSERWYETGAAAYEMSRQDMLKHNISN